MMNTEDDFLRNELMQGMDNSKMKYGNLDQIEKQLNDELQSKYGLSPTVP
jgi:hypothetical protein